MVYVTLGTNYRLDPKVFLTGKSDQKLAGVEVPSADIEANLVSAQKTGWDALKKRHQADVGRLLQRTQHRSGRQPTRPCPPTGFSPTPIRRPRRPVTWRNSISNTADIC